MLTSPLPPTSNFGTWIESLELTSVDDNSYIDLSTATEVTLSLTPATTLQHLDELTLKFSTGEITLPAPGVIQWRVEEPRMAALNIGPYKVKLSIEINGDVMGLILGTVDILG
jgi:hypothetical protein